MKKRSIFLLIVVVILLFKLNLYSQTPESFNYQAVIRDNAGELITNQSVSVRVSIHDITADGTPVFSEEHTLTTSSYGLINLQVGEGTVSQGSFASIDWSTNKKYMQIEVNAGNSFVDLGTVQLLSVPYALYANNVANKNDADADPGNEIQVLSISNDTVYLSNGGFVKLPIDNINDADADPINEIQDLSITDDILTITNNSLATPIALAAYTGTNTDEQKLTILGDTLYISNGNDVVLPYDSSNWLIDGNNMYYNGGNVGIGSAFPVSNLEVKANSVGSDALFQVINANNDTVFAVYPDGVKIFVDSEAKGKAGGFAISGRSPTKAGEVDILKVTLDSTRIYVSDTVNAKGKAGGFAISGRSPTKGITNDYLLVTGDSTRIYINDTSTVKGKAGGFAISGRSPTKGAVNDYLQVTRDSTRVYITEPTTKGKAGGFAISGRSPTKGVETDYFNISIDTTAQIIDPSKARIFWYPKKEAFLAGRVLVESPDSIGLNSMSTGYESKAIGDYSQAMGYQSIARGTYATAIGREAEADTNAFAFGYKAKALANDAFAIGSGAYATGEKSFAIGSTGIDEDGNPTTNTIASGDYSFAIGLGNQAQGKGATALGANTHAIGDFSSSLGIDTYASGWSSIAIGSRAHANGSSSTSIGYNTYADGDYSQAFGYKTTAANDYSFVCGIYNNTNYMTSGGTGGYLFVVGNGFLNFPDIMPTRRNALALYQGGELLVPGIYNTTVTSARDVYVDWGGKLGYISSSLRYKDNIINMENIDWLYDLRPVNFNYKCDENHTKQYGLIAEEVEKINPLFVSYNEKGEVETVSYSQLVTPMIKAIQEQQEIIDKQMNEIESQKTKNIELEKRLAEIEKLLLTK